MSLHGFTDQTLNEYFLWLHDTFYFGDFWENIGIIQIWTPIYVISDDNRFSSNNTNESWCNLTFLFANNFASCIYIYIPAFNILSSVDLCGIQFHINPFQFQVVRVENVEKLKGLGLIHTRLCNFNNATSPFAMCVQDSRAHFFPFTMGFVSKPCYNCWSLPNISDILFKLFSSHLPEKVS